MVFYCLLAKAEREMKMRHLTNTFDPRNKRAKTALIKDFRETPEQAWAHWLAYLKDKFIGPPRATEHYSEAELEAMGMVGIYAGELGEEWGLGFWGFDTYMA